MVELLTIVPALSVAILWHEAAHAAFALAASPGRVALQVGFGPAARLRMGRLDVRLAPILLGGRCTYDGSERRGDRALIAAAGPVASAFLAALAFSLRPDIWQLSSTLGDLCDLVMVASAFGAVFTALPIDYGDSDSDGLAVLRALAPAPRVADKVPRAERRPDHPLRAPFAIVLGLTTVGGFMASFWLGAVTAAMFGMLYLSERSGAA